MSTSGAWTIAASGRSTKRVGEHVTAEALVVDTRWNGGGDLVDDLASFLSGRTVVVIAHRLQTAKAADHIIVLEDGEVVQEGTFDEIVRQVVQIGAE